MIENDRWLLPEGIEELLPREAARLEFLRRGLLELFGSWGYELVIPPLIEYLESLLTGTGNDLDLQTFKLTDQMTGRMMGVRADMTPQVARIDAHHLRRDIPTRLCYLGTVLRTRPQGHGMSRAPYQVGAEIYGHAGIESDVEVLCLMVEALRRTGLEQIHIDLGHVGIFRALAEQAQFSPEQESELFDALQRKSKPEIAELLDAGGYSDATIKYFGRLTDLNGDAAVLDEARRALAGAGEAVEAAVERLGRIAEAAQRRLGGVPLHFDLAELRGYHYHTGAVFAAFVPGRGQAVAQGGRYDDIGQVFGRARPATGFSTDLRLVMELVADNLPPVHAIFAPGSDDPALEATVRRLRESGERVVQALAGQQGGPLEMGCQRQLVLQNGTWEIAPVGR